LKYRLLGIVESSALADECRAEREGAPVMLKLFHVHTSDEAVAREVSALARQMASLQHSALLSTLDVGIAHGRLAVVRRDVGGYTLGTVLRRLHTREVRIPPTLALALVVELLDGLHALHQAGLVHGAVTPGNVWLSPFGQVSVAEVGALHALKRSAALAPLIAQGRNSYRAPEAAQGQGSVAADVYASGAMLYELLTLREAAVGRVATRANQVPAPSRLVRALNARVDPVVMRALEHSAARRYRSAHDFAEALRECVLASGAWPTREETTRFVSELFPQDVVVQQLRPPPWSETFSLVSIEGVQLAASQPAAEPLAERTAFSGGVVGPDTPTLDGLPAFEVPAPADQMHPTIEWEAPSAPESPSAQAPEVPLKRPRFRLLEDLSVMQRRPAAPPRSSPPAAPARTRRQFAFPFRRETDAVVPDVARLRQSAHRRRLQAARLSAAALFAGVTALVLFWGFTTEDHVGSLIHSLPRPIAELVDSWRHKQSSRLGSSGARACYEPPLTANSRLSVKVVGDATLEIDGRVVCGPVEGVVPVSPGQRMLVVDAPGGHWEGLVRIEPGKVTIVAPPLTPN
jgi:serine/threonine protein kinase